MATVFKREGAGRANRWYAQIKVAGKWKVIRLPSTYKGPDAVPKSKALHQALEAELVANREAGIDLEEAKAHEFTQKLLALASPASKTKAESTHDFLEKWLAYSDELMKQNKLSGNTLRLRKAAIQRFTSYLGKQTAKSVPMVFTLQTANDFSASLEKKGLATNTVKATITPLSMAAEYAIKQGKLTRNPFEKVGISGKNAKLRDVFTAEQADAILAYPNEQTRLVFALMLCTGIRSGDAMNMTYENIDFKKKVMTWTPDKQRTGKERPMTVPVCDKLLRLIGTGTGKIAKINSQPLLAKRFNQLKLDLDLRGNLTPHSSRHFFVSLLANAGIPEEIRMKLAGHSAGKNKVHQIYTHLEIETLRKELNKVDWLK